MFFYIHLTYKSIDCNYKLLFPCEFKDPDILLNCRLLFHSYVGHNVVASINHFKND